MDALKRSRRPLRAQLTKLMNEIEQELHRSAPDRTVVQVKLDVMFKSFQKIDALDQEILAQLFSSEGNSEE